MFYALLSLIWISSAGLFLNVTTGLGLFRTADPTFLHLVVAVGTGILALTTHVWAMFHILRGGKKLLASVESWEPELRDEVLKNVRGIWRKVLPGALAACVVLLAALVSGAWLHAGEAGLRAVHAVTAYLAVIVHMHAAVRETLGLFRQEAVIGEVDDLARRKSDSTEIPG